MSSPSPSTPLRDSSDRRSSHTDVEAGIHSEKIESPTSPSKQEKQEEQQAPDPTPAATTPVVDKGFRAWSTAVGCFLAFFATLGYVTAFGPYQAYYERILIHNSASDISWIGSIMLCSCYLMSIPAAILSDKLGPHAVVSIGTFFVVFGVMMSSISKEYYQFFLSHGLCTGIGMGLIFLPTISLPNQHFNKYRGLVVSTAIGGSSVGGVLWAIIFNRMINFDNVSYGWTQRAIGFIMLFSLVLSTLLIRSNVPRNRGVKFSSFPFITALKNDKIAALALATTLSFFGLYVPYFYATPYAEALGAKPQTAFYVTSVLNGLTFFGRFGMGAISDRLGHFNMLIFCTVVSGFLVFTWAAVESLTGLWVFVAVFGFFSGAGVSLQSPAVVIACPGEGIAKLKVVPAYIAICCSLASIGALGGAPVAGKLLTNQVKSNGGEVTPADFKPMMWFSGSILFLSSALYAYARLRVSTAVWKKL